jgi:preprotein translocase SecE subunit
LSFRLPAPFWSTKTTNERENIAAEKKVKEKMATKTPALPDIPSASAGGFAEYLRGVRAELKKAEWPSRAELIRLTQVVLVLIAIVALYCGGLDYLLGLVTNKLFNRTA